MDCKSFYLNKIPDVNLPNIKESVWKGEGYFLQEDEVECIEEIKNIYNKFKEGELVPHEKFKFYSKVCCLSYNLMVYIYSLRKHLDNFTLCELMCSVIRLRFYSISYGDKVDDDITINSNTTTLLDFIFNKRKGLTKPNQFKFEPSFISRLPLETNSEALLYTICLYNLLFFNCRKTKNEIEIELVSKGTELFTIIKSPLEESHRIRLINKLKMKEVLYHCHNLEAIVDEGLVATEDIPELVGAEFVGTELFSWFVWSGR